MDPYGDLEEATLPDMTYCTKGNMEEALLSGPAVCSSHVKGCMPVNALNAETDLAFWSGETDSEPFWCAKLTDISPVSLIVIHAAHEDAGRGAGEMKNIYCELLDNADEPLWSSPLQSVRNNSNEDKLMIFAPAVRCKKVKICKEGLNLGIRAVQCFLMSPNKYKLSKTILTIDKYAVPQPFSLNELANSTAYSNLFTSSACYELAHQESHVEEREQEAMNLAHHLLGVWDGQSKTFRHGRHTETVRIVLLHILEAAKSLFIADSKVANVRSPCYVFGDIHGNFADLSYFMTNLIPFKHVKYSGHTYLFLGDYVDRGPHDVECLAYLCCLKIQAPDKVFLLRGNHEDRRQNRVLEESFYNHCISLFGPSGKEVYERANDLFDNLPLCGIINDSIFACHGGVPRVPLDEVTGKPMRIRDAVEKIPFPLSTVGDSDDPYQQLATDLLWADPAKDIDYFKKNEARGCSCIYGQKAVEEFLENNGFEFMMRAHQFFSFGVNISKGGKVITLFSSSNYCDYTSCAGCALVGANGKIQLLMKEHTVNADEE